MIGAMSKSNRLIDDFKEERSCPSSRLRARIRAEKRNGKGKDQPIIYPPE